VSAYYNVFFHPLREIYQEVKWRPTPNFEICGIWSWLAETLRNTLNLRHRRGSCSHSDPSGLLDWCIWIQPTLGSVMEMLRRSTHLFSGWYFLLLKH